MKENLTTKSLSILQYICRLLFLSHKILTTELYVLADKMINDVYYFQPDLLSRHIKVRTTSNGKNHKK